MQSLQPLAVSIISVLLCFGVGASESSVPNWLDDCPSCVALRLSFLPQGTWPEEQVPEGFLEYWPLEEGLELQEDGSVTRERLAILVTEGAVLRLEPGSRWMLRVVVEGVWTPELQVNVPVVEPKLLPPEVPGVQASLQQELAIRFWPAATVKGRFFGPEEEMNAAIPSASDAAPSDLKRVLLAAEPPPRKLIRSTPLADLPKIAFHCPVAEDGNWACSVPAVQLDLVLRPGSYVPHYRAGLSLAPGEIKDLGRLRLARGASLVGWVEAAVGQVLPDLAKIRLLPFSPGLVKVQPPSSSKRPEGSLTSRLLDARVDENGMFRFRGVNPGSYIVEVEHPGFASQAVAPVDVFPDRETALGSPIVLYPPLALEIRIEPVVDPWGKPWRLDLTRYSAQSATLLDETRLEGRAGLDGSWQVEEQAPGRYSFHVVDSRGDPWWVEPDWQVSAAAEAVRWVEIPILRVEGEIRSGENPVQGKLIFGGRHGAVRIETASSEEGFFSVFLPRAGEWLLDVEAELLARAKARTRVRIEEGDDEVLLRIDLPTSQVSGRVVDPSGQGLEGVSVALAARDGPSQAGVSAADGEFSFGAVPDGPFRLSAQPRAADGVLYKAYYQGTLAADTNLEEVTLHLLGSIDREVEVLGPAGPVVGAWLESMVVEPFPAPAVPTARTNELGWATLSLGPEARLLRVAIAPPGHAFSVRDVVIEEENATISLPVDDWGGTLRLVSRSTLPKADSRQRLWLLVDGRGIPLPQLVKWVHAHQGRFSFTGGPLDATIPRLAAGHYQLCLGDPAQPEEAVCDEGDLSRGGELVLALEF